MVRFKRSSAWLNKDEIKVIRSGCGIGIFVPVVH